MIGCSSYNSFRHVPIDNSHVSETPWFTTFSGESKPNPNLDFKKNQQIQNPLSRMSRLLWLWSFVNLILLFFQLPTCKSSSISDLFDSWCKEYGKTYASEQEKEHRLKVFEQNYEYVTQQNSRANSSYTLSLNAFADLTNHEFKAKYLGLSASASDLIIRLNSRQGEIEGPDLVKESDIPSSVDWRKKGAVTGVKDQGSCGMRVFLPFLDSFD